MNNLLTDTQKEIVTMAAKFAAKEIAPIVEADEKNSYFRRELFYKLGEAGLLGITADPEWGGTGLGTLEYSLLLEELAYYSGGYAVSVSVTNLPQSIIDKFGIREQKEKYIPDIVSGKKIGAFALTEPSSGSDATGIKMKAEKKDGFYILNGVKQFITNGEFADIFIVIARTNTEHRSKGTSAFIVEKNTPGLRGGKLEKKMGMRVSPTQEMIFENVKVPEKNLLAQEGMGIQIPFTALDSGRLSIASIANGISRAALDRAHKYSKEREQFGKPIFDFQGVSFLLADMATELEASRSLMRTAAMLKDAGHPFTLQASMAKLHATEACMRITTDAVQILGGYGYMEDYIVERYMREAKMLQIVEGTSQIQRLVISKNLN